MPITPEQAEARRKHIGSSDVAAILGVCPHSTARRVWESKVYGTNHCAGKHADLGTFLEGGVIDYAAEFFGLQIAARSETVEYPLDPLFAANLDARTCAGEPVEIKTIRFAAPDRAEWGPAGTDEVPTRVMLQVQHQMLCTLATSAYVVALDQNWSVRLYIVERSEAAVGLIRERCREWWERFVVGRVPPPGEPSREWLSLLPRRSMKYAEVPRETTKKALTLRAQIRALEAQREAADTAVLAALGDAEIAEGSEYLVTFKADKRGRRTLRMSARGEWRKELEADYGRDDE